MPLPKRQTVPKAGATKSSSDSRFAAFETDPKFRLPSKKHAKTKLDPRFSRLRTDSDFHAKASVDRYGRPLAKDAGKKDLERLYELGPEDSDSESDEDGAPTETKRDQAVLRELAKANKRGFDPIRDGGLSSSSDDSDDEDDAEEDEDEVEDQTELAGQGNDVPMGEVTSRLAAVNMDWDNIRATDIMAVASSFVPADGRLLNVTIYPSEFGQQRLEREAMEGPPRDIFSASAKGRAQNISAAGDLDESGSEGADQAKDDAPLEAGTEDFDSKALRTYQLDRLRYYYALLTCSSPHVAKAIYDNMDGREYLSSANFFDLRFVPDDVEFDAEPHDECETLPHGYKPNEFVTDALSHSKVKLTWDADDTTRKEVQKRAFSRKELDENELQAYLGTDSSSSEDDEESGRTVKAASLRAALGLDAASKSAQSRTKSSSKKDRDMKKPDTEIEVTFTSGLAADGSKGSVFANEPEENTLEKYVRKRKERKLKRKERAKAIKEGRDPDAEPDAETTLPAEAAEGDPWNDPFFASDQETGKALEIKANREKRAKKREEREQREKASAEERANLELLMVDEKDSKMQHFDMNEIIKAEKAQKKGKKNKKAAKEAPVDNFEMNTDDPRFAKLFESHEFAIDPTNPRYKETASMKKLLEEGRKKRKLDREDEPEQKKPRRETAGEPDDVKRLAAKVVLSFVLASIMTSIASILAMALNQAFNTKGQFTIRTPVRYIRDSILETEWKKNYAWRPFLDPLIIGLGDQQLISGYAVFQNSFQVQGAHFVLVLYVGALSSSSHLAALITLRKYFHRYRLIAKIRLTLVIVFACFLLCSMIAAISMPEMVRLTPQGEIETQPRVHRLSFVPMIFIILEFSTALMCIMWKPWNPLIAFIIQLILAVLSVILVLSQKFSVPEEPGKWCGLQDQGENVWGFGQTLSVVMLLMQGVSAT
ncbi:hypothetical protein BU23DRAFT_593325 [Bimuria novae-zelandiae CBS 107.79]|uniref:Uncharacterized protein n=1 Tax=Bimuria novae-zelandiae CBS 107.79 TaxID=1447943 RepID=A0A6A5UYM6_9PLEO|nr:hypothetical protein BU23DRAFT_593325 [Bimuria novae-zelandiae CBS 107.79]